MITFIRTATIQQGIKAATAFEWAVKVATHLNTQHGSNIQIHRAVGGNQSQVRWISTYDSLAHVDEMSDKFDADEGYAQLLDEAHETGMFVGESVTDQFLASVP